MAPTKMLCDRYEALRSDALAMLSSTSTKSFGLTLLCNRGMAAWIKTWSEITPLPAKSSSTATEAQVEVFAHIPADIKNQLASLIALAAVHIHKEAVSF